MHHFGGRAAGADCTKLTPFPSYLTVAMGGYALGCVLLEVGPPELTRAALLFIVPAMLGCVTLRAAAAGELGEIFAYPEQCGCPGDPDESGA